MNITVEMTEQEFDSFRQWRGKLEELDATKLYESLMAEIVRQCPRGPDVYREFAKMRELGDGLHNILKHWLLCQKKV